ncbi:hypothetical protein O181_113368 [Austropuccinia psidii MF-1]|uniref:Uncharacterized protein n=1 Tax=Austropuccinia psidii MF-1 TaxID=1389203 RepID=A0A9Q3K2A8_9BASI|nr:hypothetical protein [Austropuccinia psidii MF-1]
MTIVHKSGNIHNNADVLSRWALPKIPDNPGYVPTSAEPQIPIEGINITDVGTEFFEEVRESYKQYKNCHILTSLLDKDCKDVALANSLDDIWKTSYDNGRYHFFMVYYIIDLNTHVSWLYVVEGLLTQHYQNAMIAFILDICLKTEKWKELRHVPGGHLGEKMSSSTVIVVIDGRKPIKLLVKDLV